jgi:hypothetical protein
MSRRKLPRFSAELPLAPGSKWALWFAWSGSNWRHLVLGRLSERKARALASELNAVLDKHEEARDGK